MSFACYTRVLRSSVYSDAASNQIAQVWLPVRAALRIQGRAPGAADRSANVNNSAAAPGPQLTETSTQVAAISACGPQSSACTFKQQIVVSTAASLRSTAIGPVVLCVLVGVCGFRLTCMARMELTAAIHLRASRKTHPPLPASL